MGVVSQTYNRREAAPLKLEHTDHNARTVANAHQQVPVDHWGRRYTPPDAIDK